MFLTREELKALTRATRRVNQRAELRSMGIQYVETETGGLRVLRAEIDRVMLGGVTKEVTPNYGAINGR